MGAFCSSLFDVDNGTSTSSASTKPAADNEHRCGQKGNANDETPIGIQPATPLVGRANNPPIGVPVIDFTNDAAQPRHPPKPNSGKSKSPSTKRMSTVFTSSIRNASGELIGSADNGDELAASQISASQRPKSPDASSWANAAPSAVTARETGQHMAHFGELQDFDNVQLISVACTGSDTSTSHNKHRRSSDSEEREALRTIRCDESGPPVIRSILLKPCALTVGAARSPSGLSPARQQDSNGSLPYTSSEPPCPGSPLLSGSSSRRRREPPPVTAVMCQVASAAYVPLPHTSTVSGNPVPMDEGEPEDGRGSPVDSDLTTSSSRVSFVLPLGEPEVVTPKLRPRGGSSFGTPQSPPSPRRPQGGVGHVAAAAHHPALTLPPPAAPALSQDAQALLQRLRPDLVAELPSRNNIGHKNPFSP